MRYAPRSNGRYQDPLWREQKPLLSRTARKGFILIAIVLALVGGVRIIHANGASAESLAGSQGQSTDSKKVTKFKSQVKQLMADNPDITMSVNAATPSGAIVQVGATPPFNGASTGKLITAADYLHRVEIGKDSLTKKIAGLPASDWLERMIVNSDNTAWEHLNGYLGHPDLAAYAKSVGLPNYQPDGNMFPSVTIATLLQKLWQHQLLNQEHTDLLLGYMKEANYRGYMVPAVPSGYTIYHKVGVDEDNVHDAAIITHNGKTLILTVYTNGNGMYEWDARAELIQTITRDAIAAYF